MPEFGNLSSNSRFPRDSAYALIKRHPFEFPTGEAQIYNNSAFWLLGLVVEKASGISYEDYVEKKLFAPLGMTRSSYCNSAENVERRAHGYQVRGLTFIGHGGGIGGFTSDATWYPDAKAAIVVLFNSNGPIDPGAIAGELAAQLLPWTPTTPKQLTGDATPLVGTYKGPSRGREMVMTVTQGAAGPMFSVNGSPAREASWEQGWSFRQGGTMLTFRRAGSSGLATELIFQGGAAYYVLKRQ